MRSTDGAGNIYQWVDSEYWLIVDFGCHAPEILRGFSSQAEALEHVKGFIGWETRLAVVRLDCIRAFGVRTGAEP